MSDIRDLGDFSYQILEREAEKRRLRKEIEILMVAFLEAGGEIKVVSVKPTPKANKFLNRKQKKNVRF